MRFTAKICDDIDAGTITVDANSLEAYETGSLLTNSESLDLSHSELREIARTVNLVKTIKNIYVNAAPDTWIDPSGYMYKGLTVDFDYANPSPPVTFDSVYNSGTVEIELPDDTRYFGDTWTEDNSDGDRGASDNAGNVAIFEYLDHETIFRISLRESVGAEGAVPGGFWNVIVNDTPVSHYDVAGSSPIYRDDMGNTEAMVYIPSAKFVQNSSTSVKIEIQWQVYNPNTGEYESLTDLEQFDRIVSYMAVGYEAKDDTPGGDIDIDDQTKTWVEIPLDYDNIDDVSITYRLYGYDFRVLFSSSP